MKTSDLRRTYLDFFKSKNHRVYSSDSLVPHNDPSLLFTGAGMNQFKPYFLGLKKDVTRATSCQKCLRTADLDRVGKTAYHHSFFEMLGNFSFGDYFKEEAIAWGWEFVTKALLLPEDKLWVSVYQDDDEAFGIWKNKIGLSESRIVRMGAEDNFWPSNAPKDGPNGPCGPCSEIYVGREAGKGVEIWNLVFTQFDRQSDGSLKPLPQKNIDTGMGLERTAAVLQGVNSNFENDLFVEVRRDLKHLTDRSRAQGNETETTAHENAVMDHVRAAVFAIADGANPSNEGRGYVIRKVIRLASDHLRRAGARETGTLKSLVASIVGVMGEAYPEIARAQKSAESVIENEERAYEEARRKVESAKKGSMSAAEFAFMLYDTHGVPLDDIREKFVKENYAWDEDAFSQLLDEQKERSRGASKIAGEIFKKDEIVEKTRDLAPTSFLGYDSLETEARLVLIIKPGTETQRLAAGDEGVLVFDRSPFYAESGGQVGDAGVIESKQFAADVVDTQYADRIITHRVRMTRGEASAGIVAQLRVDPKRRADVMKNHTATHLLHAALRKVLGDHVKQAGSLVAPDYLRFDFTHPKALDAAQMAEIESMVAAQILGGSRLEKRVMSKEQATAEGAIAFFGEKYGEEVRVVSIGEFSKELCGGTHLDAVSEIGRFKITSEGSIQAGVRRIEAVTGRGADLYFAEQEKMITDLSREFTTAAEVLPGALRASREGVGASRARLMTAVARTAAKKMKGQSALFVQRLDGADADLFKSIGDELRGLGRPFAALLAGSVSDKAAIAVMASPDLAAGGFPSGKIVKEISALVEGNGGGRPDFAVGGGKRIDRLGEAMTLGEQRLREELTKLNRL